MSRKEMIRFLSKKGVAASTKDSTVRLENKVKRFHAAKAMAKVERLARKAMKRAQRKARKMALCGKKTKSASARVAVVTASQGRIAA